MKTQKYGPLIKEVKTLKRDNENLPLADGFYLV